MNNDENRGRGAKLRKVVKMAMLYAGFMLACDAAALGLDSLLLGRNMLHYFTLFTLGEAGISFLLGGAIDVSGSVTYSVLKHHASKSGPDWNVDHHRKSQIKAAPYVVTGLFLLIASFLLAYPLY